MTTLWVNDQKIGAHRGGYTGFVFDITPALIPGRENQLEILVGNSNDPDLPPLKADFNFYGGIYRDLNLILTDKVHFKMTGEAAGNFLIKTSEVSKSEAQVEKTTQVTNHAAQARSKTVNIDILDPEQQRLHTLSEEVRLQPGETRQLEFHYQVLDPQLWSPKTPRLYQVQAYLTEKDTAKRTDRISSTFGLRWFEADPEKGFYLNGEPMKLIGANRHQDHQGLGNALPTALHKKDYRVIKEMGANFIRTAHYPQDPEVYRICDELGLIIWSEIPVINDVTDSKTYHQQALSMQREQILQFFNHPSVVFWGYMNEIFI